jgi:predicted nucleic acid-binding Zn ribbon protein
LPAAAAPAADVGQPASLLLAWRALAFAAWQPSPFHLPCVRT